MLNEMQKTILVKSIEIRVENGEKAEDILSSFENLSIVEKKELGEKISVIYSPTLAEALTEKITELSAACNKTIEDGVTISVNGVYEHFSYGIASGDQSNIDSIFQLSAATKLDQPYHCDGGSCKLYTPEQIATLYIAEKMNCTVQQTYFNQLKHMIEDTYTQETDVDTVLRISYGYPLTGKYLDDYNRILAQSNIIVKAVSGNETTTEATA